jgi:hypothetical protein
LCAALSVAGLAFATLLWFHTVPLSAGSVLLPAGLEQSGPIAFLIYAAVLGAVSVGLWKGNNWARRTLLVLAVGGILLVIPALSSAVADGRVLTIIREGLQIIVRVVIVYYLWQEPIKIWFSRELT